MAQANRSMVNMLLLGIAVVALVVLVYFLAVQSQTDDQSQEVGVVNADPTVDSVYVAISGDHSYNPANDVAVVTPAENTTTTLWAYGVASDNNGCQNMDTKTNWALQAYRTGQTAVCTPDQNDCYSWSGENMSTMATFAGCTGNGDLDMNYQMQFDMFYWADSTDAGGTYPSDNWTVKVIAGDEDFATAAATDTFEMASTLALTVTSSVNYGSVVLGGNSSTKTITFTQTGNVAYDVQQTAAANAMTCDEEGVISWTAVHMSTNSEFVYGAGTAFVGSTGNAPLDISVAARTSDVTANTANGYLILQAPSYGVRGTCTGTVTFSAVSNT